MSNGRFRVSLILIITALAGVCATAQGAKRQVISLDGLWQIAQGSMDKQPTAYKARVPVPGLVDMAKPAFEQVGVKSDKRQAFWYRRKFKVEGKIPQIARLKIHKAKYGTRLYINGKLIGDHLPCFTPVEFDVREHLQLGGAENEIVIRVGAFTDSVPKSIPTGWDFEKDRYIPGIYDSVELILSGGPFINILQVVPNIKTKQARLVGELVNTTDAAAELKYVLREAKSGKKIASGQKALRGLEGHDPIFFDFKVEVKGCRLWSPEEPFLYEIELNTGGDDKKVRFGMRSFRFDPETGRAVLNDRPYYLRGTNVCILRFFEDSERGDKPWREEWVRRLHRKFKSMGWNSVRYCIGFPPEKWYEIADEEGLLIADEFPIWYLGHDKKVWPDELKSTQIAKEYDEWVRERWNHACVVIWDAQNESITKETGPAIRQIRGMDISNRPWDNGWGRQEKIDDAFEAHPYLFIRIHLGKSMPQGGDFKLSELADMDGVPSLWPAEKVGKCIIINEYAWLWINRDGTPTTLTEKVWARILGADASIAQRRRVYARYMAALTEFWRCHRKVAGVMHFCGLGYSRPGSGETSDNFIDLEKLEFEPEFEKYVKDSFAAVGLMIDEWAEEYQGGKEREFTVVLINDTYEDWAGPVRLKIVRKGRTVVEESRKCVVKSLGREVLEFSMLVPERAGDYQLIAEISGAGGRAVRSLRDFKVK